MNLKNLYTLQKILDEKINTTHDLLKENLIPHKILSLEVEVGELANETRCFKFWSLKEASPENIILEEFVDCLHFILSLGLDLKFNDISVNDLYIDDQNKNLTEYFLMLFNSISLFHNTLSRENYIYVFSNFLSLGKKLGFTPEEMEKAYLHKNNINHQRQAEGY